MVRIGKKELLTFAKLFDGNEEWEHARLPVIHSTELMKALENFAFQNETIGDLKDNVFSTRMWDETGAQKEGIIVRKVHFPSEGIEMIYSNYQDWQI